MVEEMGQGEGNLVGVSSQSLDWYEVSDGEEFMKWELGLCYCFNWHLQTDQCLTSSAESV